MRIVFRADASVEIGTGHVMRCLTLADALRQSGAECRFVTRDHPGHLAERIRERGFAVSVLTASAGVSPTRPPDHAAWAGVGWEQDAHETLAAIGDDAPDWLVVDHYAFDARWEERLRPCTGKLMVIDDLADRPHVADLLLDQNLGRMEADYAPFLPAEATLLLGPRYALLRPEFAALRDQALLARSGRRARCLLISMGGVDVADATSRILSAMKTAPLPPEVQVIVIMGRHAPALQRVQEHAAALPWKTRVVVDAPDMPRLMGDADLAIGAAGTTTWERCCMGLPTIIMETAANQSAIARAMIAAGAALDPGPHTAEEFPGRLLKALETAMSPGGLAALSARSAEICDGNGTRRVVSRMGLEAVS